MNGALLLRTLLNLSSSFFSRLPSHVSIVTKRGKREEWEHKSYGAAASRYHITKRGIVCFV